MDRFRELELFVQIAEWGSLSLAAAKLGMSNAAASRVLQALEARLNVRLVERTTRRLWLTDAGHEYHHRCAAILADLNEADSQTSDSASRPMGTLRIGSSVSFAMIHIAPAMTEFVSRFPELSVQIVTANRYSDFLDSGIDVAIRTREFEVDSGITVRKLAETRRVLAASPEYLARRGSPTAPEEILNHNLLIYNLANEPDVLKFRKGAKRQSLRINGVIDSNEGQVVRAAALSGAGILVQPLYIIHDDIVAGRLIPILTDWMLPTLSINMAYQSRRYQPAKVRTFIQFLLERCHRLGWRQQWNEF